MKVLLLSKRHPLLTSFAAFLLGAILIFSIQKVLADSTIIYACVRSNGSLRIVTQNTPCGNGETALSWNQQGPQGIQGPPGPAGSGGGPLGIFTCPGCNFSGSPLPSLVGKDFSGSDLNQAQFQSDLSNANFTGAFLSGASFQAAPTVPNENALSHSVFHNVIADQMAIFHINSAQTDFSGIHGSNGQTHLDFGSNDVVLTNANFQNIQATIHFDFPGAFPPGANPDFSNSDFTNANLSSQSDPSDFSNVDLSNVNFTGTNLQYTTGMSTANVTGVTWSNTTCPDGTNSDNDGNTCVGHF